MLFKATESAIKKKLYVDKYYKNHEDMDLDNPCVVENYNYNLKANGCLSGVDLSYDYIMNNGLVGHTHTVFYSGHNMNALLSKNRIITMSFSDRRVGYSESTSCKYTTLGYLIFPGTMKVGIPDKIKMIAWKTNGTTSASIRVVCKDSGEVLCDLNDISNENQEIKLLENLNLELLKADESILMVQAKINGAKKSKIRIASIILEF